MKKICDMCKKRTAKYVIMMTSNNAVQVCSSCRGVISRLEEKVIISEDNNEVEKAEQYRNRLEQMFKEAQQEAERSRGKEKVEMPQQRSILSELGVNLNDLAEEGKIDSVIGRENEIARVSEILSRRTKNTPVLIGEAGVGKTAIAEGLALDIVKGNAPAPLKDKQIVRLDVSSLVQGTKFRGDFEERLHRLMQEMAASKNVILFIDEMHLLVGAGSTQSSDEGMDASNILKPALARGDFQMIGATTTDEYRAIEKDAALARRFQKINIEEPSVEDAVEILTGIKKVYEDFHRVSYPADTLKTAVQLAHRYITDRQLPDKAIDLLDETGAKKNQNRKEKDDILLVHPSDIAHLVEQKTGIPAQKMTEKEGTQLVELESRLSDSVIGQPEAIQKVAKALRRNRMGFRKNKRPIGSFLFVGPTGVGKTELSKVLTADMFGSSEAMLRFDMSEYMEKHSVSSLIGSPPGYVGFETPGQLTEAVRRKPYSLILVDEIEKAHPDVLNLFLQIMDEGHVTDAKGRNISFRDTLIIMTSNAGTNVPQEATVGFGAKAKSAQSAIEMLKPYFKAEMLNRFDGIIQFNELSKCDLRKIVDLLLEETVEVLREQNIEVSITNTVKTKLVDSSYDSDMGARPLRRMIADEVEDALATYCLANPNEKDIQLAIRSGDIVATAKTPATKTVKKKKTIEA